MTKDNALRLLEIYGKAWETQDPDLICTLFTDDATYDAPDSPLCIGRDAIRTYWQQKICREEENISFHIQNVWMEGSTVIAEWKACFTLVQKKKRSFKKKRKRVTMTEVAILTVRDERFSSLREYYKETMTPKQPDQQGVE